MAPPGRARGSRRLRVALAAYLVVGLALVVSPIGWALNRLTVRMHTAVLHGLGIRSELLRPETYGLLLNVLLFVPAGWLLARLLPAPGALLVGGLAACSALVELVQSGWLDRQGSLVDVLANAAGAALGVLLARARRRGRRIPG